jgi:hypothetical protein
MCAVHAACGSDYQIYQDLVVQIVVLIHIQDEVGQPKWCQ